MIEEWRYIPEFPDYMVSNSFRIKNKKTGRVLHVNENQNGTRFVSLRKDGKTYSKAVYLLKKSTFGL